MMGVKVFVRGTKRILRIRRCRRCESAFNHATKLQSRKEVELFRQRVLFLRWPTILRVLFGHELPKTVVQLWIFRESLGGVVEDLDESSHIRISLDRITNTKCLRRGFNG